MNKSRTSALFMLLPLAMVSGCSTNAKQIPDQLTCIPTKLFRCEPDERSCMTIPIDSSFGSVQIDVNLEEKRVKSFSKEKILSQSEIFSVEEENGLIYLNGRGRGFDKALRSWNAVINRNNGRLYSSSITTGAGHVTYGECYED